MKYGVDRYMLAGEPFETWCKIPIKQQHQGPPAYREAGPAILKSGCRIWCQKEGEYHRDNGPAVIYPDGSFTFWKNDEEIK